MKDKISYKDLFAYALNLEEQLKHLEQEISQAGILEDIFSLINENSNVGYFKFTRQGKIIDLNNAAIRFLGLSNYKKKSNLNSELLLFLFKDLEQNGSFINTEKTLNLPGGNSLNILVSAKSITVDKVEYIAGFVFDILYDKKIRDSLDRSRANLTIILQSLNSPAWSLDEHGRLTAFNSSFREYFKRKYKILPELEQEVFSRLSRNDKKFWQNLFDDAIKGERLKKEIKISLLGYSLYYNVMVNPVFNDRYEIIGASFITYDISELKKTENILLKSKKHLSELIDNIPHMVWLKDKNGRYVIVNQSFLEFWKIKGENIIEKNDKELVRINKNLASIFDDSSALLLKKHVFVEKAIKDGTQEYWFEIHTAPICNEEGMVIGVTGMAREISERKRIENVLLESEEKFRQFAENTSDSFILRSQKGTLYVNPAFENIYGRALNNAYQVKYIPLEWIHSEDRKRIAAIYRSDDFIKTGAFNSEYRVIKPDGLITWVWERSFPIFNEKGEVFRIISVASDFTKQKVLEQDLIKIKTQQQAILDNIPHLAWLKDRQGKYISVNDAFEKYYKCEAKDIINKTDYDICIPELANQYSGNDELVITSKRQQQFEEEIKTPEGTLYTETIKTPIFNKQGELIGITGISRDITSYKVLERQLRLNDERLKALLKNSSDALTVVDKHGHIVFESSLFSRISGYDLDELKNKPFICLVAEIDQPKFLKAIEEVINNPEIQQTIEFQCQRKDLSKIYIESIISNHLSNSLINGLVVNSRDITERKQAEIKEKEYQENLLFLQNTALDFLSISTSEEIYKYICQKIQELVKESVVIFSSYEATEDCLVTQNITGIDKFINVVVEFLGNNLNYYKTYLTPEMRHEIIYHSNHLSELHGGFYKISNCQIPLLACKALERLISLNKIYGMGAVKSGTLLGVILIFTRYDNDIKDKRIIETLIYQASIALQRRRLEKELIAAKEKAEESDKLKSAFLANMSHEIRTPVNGILGFSQLLTDGNLSRKKRNEYADIINNNISSLTTLIDDILDMAIIEEGQVKLRKQEVNIKLLLEEVYSNYLNNKFLSKGKKLSYKLTKELSDKEALVYTDPLRIKQILNNLIGNAFKFTEKGIIEVGCRKENNNLSFFVKDTGMGISQEKKDSVFNRFIQADSSVTRKHGGSGLGLAISKGLVEILDGKIWVESELGKGSQFFFTIPLDNNRKTEQQDMARSQDMDSNVLQKLQK
jgi:PAS domain S-box-containing protein